MDGRQRTAHLFHSSRRGLEVKFLRPTPLGPDLSLRAEPEKVSESEIVVNAELVFDDKQRATLRAQWLRFRPR